MKMYNKIYQFGELKRLEKILKSIGNHKLYENKNKNKKDDNERMVIISTGENRNIFSSIPSEIIDFLSKSGDFDMDIFDFKNNQISVSTYWDILNTVKYLLSIIEYDLLYAFVQSDNQLDDILF